MNLKNTNNDLFCTLSFQFCSLFFGSVLPPSSQTSNQPAMTQEILASDSEDDGEV